MSPFLQLSDPNITGVINLVLPKYFSWFESLFYTNTGQNSLMYILLFLSCKFFKVFCKFLSLFLLISQSFIFILAAGVPGLELKINE